MSYLDDQLLPDVSSAANRLETLINEVPEKAKLLEPGGFSHKPAPGKWSKKEIMGHITDSAFNNLQRFIRTQYEDLPNIAYDQDRWVEFNNWQEIETAQLIALWTAVNKQILRAIRTMPESRYSRECMTGKDNHTIEWLFRDYVRHMEYHLHQITTENQGFI